MPSSFPINRCDVAVVGAGLAGLACAATLDRAGVDVRVFEASDGVGGRVRTDLVDGFTLDRGFQVLLTAYEEVMAQVDVDRLRLRPFKPGSLVWNGGGLQRMGDPFRDPASAAGSLMANVGTLGDKLKVAKLRRRLLALDSAALSYGPDRSTQDELEELGFTPGFIDTFFRPFLGGVFLERSLDTSAHLFRYYFRCFAAGDAALPEGGMQRLPQALAAPITDRVTLGARVQSVTPNSIELIGGATVDAEHVVVAVDAATAESLVGLPAPGFKPTLTAYFAAESAPVDEPILILDGEGVGPANHVAVVSNVAPTYAPPGAHLVSVSGVGPSAGAPERFEQNARPQLRRWFGADVDGWTHLRTYSIPHALPRHPAGSLATRPPPDLSGVVIAGDYREFGSIQGALLSGRRAAEGILERDTNREHDHVA